MNELTFIPDGYELDGSVPTLKGIHGAVEFKYRPCTIDERDELRAKVSAAKDGKSAPIIAAKLAEKIRSWDVTAPDKSAVPITAANILRLEPRIIDRLYWIVCEGEPDGLPDWHTSKIGREVVAKPLEDAEKN